MFVCGILWVSVTSLLYSNLSLLRDKKKIGRLLFKTANINSLHIYCAFRFYDDDG